jgi:hypothetical protein
MEMNGDLPGSEKEVAMKFLWVMLAIRTVVKMISYKRNKTNTNKAGTMNKRVLHPAEFGLR